MSELTMPSPQTAAGAPVKRTWRFPGIFGLIRFVLTGKWPVARDEDDSDHSRFADRLGRVLALPMFVVFSIGALLSVVQEPIQRNWNAYVSGHAINATEVLAVFITLCLFGYGDITMVSAAGTLRDKIANSRPARERVFPSFLVFAIAVLESVAFGGLIFLLEHPATAAGWVSLIGRSAMGPLCVIWFAVTPKRIPTQDEMDARFIYRLAMAREEILRTINFKSVNNLMFMPVIEQLRLWLNKDWNQASEQRLNEFMEMLRKLAPSAGEASFNDIQSLMAVLESQRQLAEATANKVDGHMIEVDARLNETSNRFTDWMRDAKDDLLREVQRMQEQIAALVQGQEDEEHVPAFSNQQQTPPPANPAKPTPNSKGFPKWVYDQAYVLMRERRQGEVVNLATLAERTGYEPQVVGQALRAYRPTIERKLRGNETMADNIVYANPGFLLLETTTI